MLASLLPRSQIRLAPGYRAPFRTLPVTHPVDGLPLRLDSLL